jgi:hypothetical protein
MTPPPPPGVGAPPGRPIHPHAWRYEPDEQSGGRRPSAGCSGLRQRVAELKRLVGQLKRRLLAGRLDYRR